MCPIFIETEVQIPSIRCVKLTY